jgi:hypothetical protein
MKLSLAIAKKLISLQNGEKIPYSQIQHQMIDEMLENGILKRLTHGRSKVLIYLPQKQTLVDFLQNHYGISDLQGYHNALIKKDLTRAEATAISSNSKLKGIRTFKGFLINCYSPIQAIINDEHIVLNPLKGTFQFIYDYEKFRVPEDITIVGVENSENFRYIDKQQYLFEHIKPLFVCRYPQNQNKDLIKWLQSIPNQYLHFGDFDFVGIEIYLNEYKKYIADKALFFIPPDIEKLIINHGNRNLYDIQKEKFNEKIIEEEKLKKLLILFHKYKKVLEQEICEKIY